MINHFQSNGQNFFEIQKNKCELVEFLFKEWSDPVRYTEFFAGGMVSLKSIFTMDALKIEKNYAFPLIKRRQIPKFFFVYNMLLN